MSKRYFCKVSWKNNEQPLIRDHDNGFMDIDWVLLTSEWAIREQYQKQNYGRGYDTKDDFTIDFMIEVPGEE